MSNTTLPEHKRCKRNLKYFACSFLTLIFCASHLFAQSSSSKNLILMDIGHGQKFWNDPASMEGQEAGQIERVQYMTREINKNISTQNGELGYLNEEIEASQLVDCDLLFIHIPSTKYKPGEVKAIQDYLHNGGSLFLAMDVDYWSTLAQTNVNDIIEPFGVQFGVNSPKTPTGGITKAGFLTDQSLKIPYHGGRIIEGGTPFCYNKETEEYPFGAFMELKNGGKIVVMGDGMVSLYMTSWEGVNDYQCSEFMNAVFGWLLK